MAHIDMGPVSLSDAWSEDSLLLIVPDHFAGMCV
jgi:hypothetical protein